MVNQTTSPSSYGLKYGAEEFPLMIVISIIYPCNLGCPFCPYTDGNSEIRKFYHERGGDYIPVELWQKIANEAGPYGAWMRCTGGGEPMLHPHMTEMVEYAKSKGARLWMNTNGSLFGPHPKLRNNLLRVINAGIDLIEFSMDAGDAETYDVVRPPLYRGKKHDLNKRWAEQVENIRTALDMRRELRSPTRVVVSMIRQEIIEDKLEDYKRFWLQEVGVDEVITRKFLSWDDNTTIDLSNSLDQELYADLPTEKKEPCVWPFERLNVDTLGRIALCGQDISFRTAHLFPNLHDATIKEIWQGEGFTRYRQLHMEGNGAQISPCKGCSAWLAGVRDWKHGWLKVLKTSGERYRELISQDFGYTDIEIYTPDAVKRLEEELPS
jgi:MoaA/NifB/PqqE/SkfB family radical SAM enzyme